MRVSRGRLRDLLLEGLDGLVLWGKTLRAIEATPDSARAWFEDGSRYEGRLIIGADGSQSQLRRLLYDPKLTKPSPVPAYFLGTQATATMEQVRPLLELDPNLFQGCHPSEPTWMWFSVMEKPEADISRDKHLLWRVQICLSWLAEVGSSEIPRTDAERVELMRRKSSNFHPCLRRVFTDILHSDHTPIINVPLEFWWIPEEEKQMQCYGRVTLVGDAAHSMPLCRYNISKSQAM